MENAIEVENLKKAYRNFSLDGVSFRLPKGSIMGFIGENGAGKTTTIKLMLNLIQKEAGTVRILGMDNDKDDQKIKEQVGVVLDESYFHDTLKPLQISKFMKNIFKGWDDDRFVRYMRRFKLPEDKYIKEFSKGMKTKLSIAAALAHKPKLLILDEATSGLDPVVRSEILDIFLEMIQDEECSVFLSTHITSDLERIADYITLIHNGQIKFCKSKDDVLSQYGVLRCGVNEFAQINRADYAGYRKNQFGCEALVTDKARMRQKYPSCIFDPVSLEDIMLFYARSETK